MSGLMKVQSESGAITYEDLYAGYLDVSNYLGGLYTSGEFNKQVSLFDKYQKNLVKKLRKVNSKILLKSLIDDEGVISLVCPNTLLDEKILGARLASLSCAYSDWQVFLHTRIDEITEVYVKHNLSKFLQATADQLSTEYAKLSLLDAAFNIQLLKQLGILTVQFKEINLISFGAANGQKELYATQLEPRIETANGKDDQLLVNFTARSEVPTHCVLIDSDPFWAEYYKQLNSRQADSVLALNEDLSASLHRLPEVFEDKSLALRNFITFWLLESKMLPDIADFFSGIGLVIEDNADFVVTIGAGNSDEEFESAQKKLMEIYSFLNNKGMKPVRFVMHHGSRLKPVFGGFRYASFEMLHCKLRLDLL